MQYNNVYMRLCANMNTTFDTIKVEIMTIKMNQTKKEIMQVKTKKMNVFLYCVKFIYYYFVYFLSNERMVE